jgi:hypothetical protein
MNSIFWHITPCNLVKVDILKENTSSIFIVACCLLHSGFLVGLLFSPEDGDNIFLGNVN